MTVADPEVHALASLAASLEPASGFNPDPWAASPFGWIKRRPSRQIGSIGEKLASGWLALRGFDVARSPDSEADRLVNGHRVEVKFSTLWASGRFKFQQLRDQRYDFALLLGVAPLDARCWLLPKAEILRRWQAGDGITSQHTGAEGADTAWLDVALAEPPRWLKAYGGTLAEALPVLTRSLPRRP
jgi:hypothetical protein